MVAKLDRFDANADQAVDAVVAFINAYRGEIIAVARARHITGHFVHGDGELFEHSRGRLDKETIEELADAVVYQAVKADQPL